MLTSILTFVPAAALIILLPGPDTLVVLRSLLRKGRRSAASAVAGVLTGLSTWATAAALGLAAVLRASHDAYTAVRIVGGIYLVVLGVQSLRSKFTNVPTLDEPGRGGLFGSGYLAGLASDLLNPKVGVFFVTFLPGFIPAHHSVAGVSFVLGAIFVVMTGAYFVFVLGLAANVLRWMGNTTIRRRLDRATGVVLIGFGLRLATEN